jgi:hypothetical protein
LAHIQTQNPFAIIEDGLTGTSFQAIVYPLIEGGV